MWYSAQPNFNGLLDLDTNNSTGSWDPVVSVFTDTCGNATQIACNDNSGNGNNALITDLQLDAGTLYRIKVANDDAVQEVGTLVLHFAYSPFPVLYFSDAPYTEVENSSQTVTVQPSFAPLVPMSVNYATTTAGTATPPVAPRRCS